jgi:hypothetical protein
MRRLLLLAIAAALNAPAQPARDALQTKLDTVSKGYSLDASESLHALLRVAGDFQLPMGIEWVNDAGSTRHFANAWHDATPSVILQDVLRAYPGYSSEVRNGVVHVFPAALHGDPSDLLNIRIGTFQVSGQYVRFAAQQLAFRIKQIVVPPDPAKPHGWGGSFITGKGDWPVTFTLENATVRDVLDKLSVSAALHVWLVVYPGQPAKTRTGFLKTIRADETAAREDEQFVPAFHFIGWGDQLVIR